MLSSKGGGHEIISPAFSFKQLLLVPHRQIDSKYVEPFKNILGVICLHNKLPGVLNKGKLTIYFLKRESQAHRYLK